MGMTGRVAVGVSIVLLSFTTARAVGAAETWREVKSPHFTVWSNAGDGATRTLVWQFEQIRSAMTKLFPWAKVDLARPMVVIAAKDEQTMKALAPKYWEQRGGIRPGSVWVNGRDRHYMAIRADLYGEDDTNLLNPYTSSYFSYASLVIAASFNRELPPWFLNGVAGVLSNTIVGSNYILLGPTIPWHLEALQQQQRLSLKQLVSITTESPEYLRDSGRERFDAQAWAFVHLLMFGERGKYQTAMNRFSSLLAAGKDANAALAEAIGPIDALETSFAAYLTSSIYTHQRITVDAAVKRERFATRPLPPAESAGLRAAFHVAMGRNTEARALIDEARKLDPSASDAYAAEGMLFDREDKPAEAKQAYGKAAELGSTNAYVHYRAAAASWGSGSQPDETALRDMDTKLARAIELNPRFALAYANLAEVRAVLKKPLEELVPLLGRAVELEPINAWHRIAVARVFWRYDKRDEARTAAKLALTLADTDQARAEAQRLLSQIK